MSLLKGFILLQVGEIGCILSLLYTILILPIMLLYRFLEMEMTQTEDNNQQDRRGRVNQKYPPLYQEGKETQNIKVHII